jgi:glutamyl/glutaminyl-tRNA synthetase
MLNHKVIKKHKAYKCQVNRIDRVTAKRGSRKYSAIFKRAVDAKKHMFEFRMSCWESNSSRMKIEAAQTGDCIQEDEDLTKNT